MENNFETALNYINHLKEINPTSLSNDKVLASAFMSYSANTNKPTREILQNFAEQFRKWQKQWDLFDKQKISKKPKNLDEFIDDLLLGGVSITNQ